MKNELTQKELKQRIHYDPDTGKITWKQHRKSTMIGQEAGSIESSGRMAIRIDRQRYCAAHLIILYMTGEMPRFAGFKNEDYTDRRYKNIYASEKLIKRRRKTAKRAPPARQSTTKTAIMRATEGDIQYTKISIAENLGIHKINMSSLFDELVDDDHIQKLGTGWRTTAKGHAALAKNHDFDRENPFLDMLLHFYKNCCPGIGPQQYRYF